MSFFDKARQAAEQARQAASQGIAQTTTPEAQEQMRQQASQVGSQFRDAAGKAGRGIVTAVEKIDPGILADIIIKATALQEKANRSLIAKRSAYRISEITITATIPPQIGFAIARIGDIDEIALGETRESGELVESVATADEQVVSLEGDVAPSDATASFEEGPA